MDSLFHTREIEAPTASLVYCNAVVIIHTDAIHVLYWYALQFIYFIKVFIDNVANW